MNRIRMQTRVFGIAAILLAETLVQAIAQGNRPSNDNFADRIVLAGAMVNTNGSSLGATAESGEPAHAGQPPSRSVWWTWTAPYSGIVEITTAGSDFDAVLAVYTGESLPSLSAVASSGDSGGLTNRVRFTARRQTQYQLAVDGGSDNHGFFVLQLRILTPANDFLDSATPLSGVGATSYGSNLAATSEPGEPQHAGVGGGASVWWRWEAPASGLARIRVTADFTPVIAAYEGSTFSLALVCSNDGLACSTRGEIVFDAIGGTTYRIAVDGYQGMAGPIRLQLTVWPPATNDDFINRRTMFTLPDVGTQALYLEEFSCDWLATAEPGEPNHAGLPPAHSLWWSWTAPLSCLAQISVRSDTFFPRLGVHQGSGFPLQHLPTLQSSSQDVIFSAIAGQTYQIAVDDSGEARGCFQLTVLSPPRPSNDDFTNAAPLVGSHATAYNTYYGTTREPCEPDHTIAGGAASLWWKWTAPDRVALPSRPVTISTLGSKYDTVLAVYAGSALSNLDLVAANDNAGPDTAYSRLGFVPDAASNYYIAVALHGSPDVPIGATDNSLLMTLDYGSIQTSVPYVARSTNIDSSISFTSALDISNYGVAPASPLRVRLWLRGACPQWALFTRFTYFETSLENTNLLAPFTVAPGTTMSVQVSGTVPTLSAAAQLFQTPVDNLRRLAVFATIEEAYDGTWLPLNVVFLFSAEMPGDGCIEPAVDMGVIRSGNVVQGISGEVEIASIRLEGPAFATEGSTVPIRVLAHFTGNAALALVADPAWTLSPLVTIKTNASGTNFLLTAGHVCQQTNVSITARFIFGGDENVATTNLTLLPLPFALQASLLSSDRSVLLRLTGPPTNMYVIEATDELGPAAVWQRFWTNPANGDCSWLFPIPRAAQTNHRYFRARQLP